jgi:hypothetical protein
MKHARAEWLLLSLLAVVGGCGDKSASKSNRCYQAGGTRTKVEGGTVSLPPLPCKQGREAFSLLSYGCEEFKQIAAASEKAADGGTQCCYEVEASAIPNCAVGRPLVMQGVHRTAALRAGAWV